ncbi:MAG: hypothetical protein ACYCQJ_00705 [Nitrososphaerales archaeon]
MSFIGKKFMITRFQDSVLFEKMPIDNGVASCCGYALASILLRLSIVDSDG